MTATDSTAKKLEMLRRSGSAGNGAEAGDAPRLHEAADYIAQLSEETQEELRKAIDGFLGNELLKVIEDPETTDVYRNGNGTIYRATVKDPPRLLKIEQSAADARMLIANVASAYGTPINPMRPHIERPVPWYDARFTGTLPPWSDGPMWAIRNHRSRETTLDDYESSQRAPATRIQAIKDCIAAGLKIVVFGDQGDGKTRLLDAILGEVANKVPDVRFAVLQDTPEIRPKHPNTYYLYASEEEPAVDFAKLIKINLRYGGNSHTIGELREQALSLYELWSTGSPYTGGTSIHGRSIDEGLRRNEILLARDKVPINRETRFAVKQGLGAMIQMARHNGVRGYITKVARIADVTDVWYRCVDVEKEGL